jgi:hypothetical protein
MIRKIFFAMLDMNEEMQEWDDSSIDFLLQYCYELKPFGLSILKFPFTTYLAMLTKALH